MAIDRKEIIQHFRTGRGLASGEYLQNVAYHLAGIILDQREFPTVQAFTDFCRDPDNLRSWLPSPTDREALSAGIVSALRSVHVA
jgi:hypothetical protein